MRLPKSFALIVLVYNFTVMLNAGAPPTPTRPATQLSVRRGMPNLRINTSPSALGQARSSVRNGSPALTTSSTLSSGSRGNPFDTPARTTPRRTEAPTPTLRRAGEDWDHVWTPRPSIARSSSSRQSTRTTNAPSTTTDQYGQSAPPYSPSSVENYDVEETLKSPPPMDASRKLSARRGMSNLRINTSPSTLRPARSSMRTGIPALTTSSTLPSGSRGNPFDTPARTTPRRRETPTSTVRRAGEDWDHVWTPRPSNARSSSSRQSTRTTNAPSTTFVQYGQSAPPYSPSSVEIYDVKETLKSPPPMDTSRHRLGALNAPESTGVSPPIKPTNDLESPPPYPPPPYERTNTVAQPPTTNQYPRRQYPQRQYPRHQHPRYQGYGQLYRTHPNQKSAIVRHHANAIGTVFRHHLRQGKIEFQLMGTNGNRQMGTNGNRPMGRLPARALDNRLKELSKDLGHQIKMAKADAQTFMNVQKQKQYRY